MLRTSVWISASEEDAAARLCGVVCCAGGCVDYASAIGADESLDAATRLVRGHLLRR